MSSEYFSKLNYTLANEDTAMELAMLPHGVGHLFSIAGSGGRVLPLLAKAPKRVTLVDLASEQLYLSELRFESARALTHEEFVSFWGYPPSPASAQERKSLFGKLKLSSEAGSFLRGLFEANSWESILYLGKWERTFAKLSQVIRRITGEASLKLFECRTPEEQETYLEKEFPKLRWQLALFLLGNANVFNALLYKGHFPKKNTPGSMYGFYRDAFARLLDPRQFGTARDNFFLQIVFLGRVQHSQGLPVECDPKVFQAAKAALQEVRIDYRLGDAVEQARAVDQNIDFFSFSDVPSYFQGEKEKNFMRDVSSRMAFGGSVVLRNYLHLPEGIDLSGYEETTEAHRNAIAREKVQIYDVRVYRKL